MRAACLAAVLCGCARPLEAWCEVWYEGEIVECPSVRVRDESGELRAPLFGCGSTDLWDNGGGFEGEELYFSHRTGELVAVRHWSDTDIEGVWYGRVVSCREMCSYEEHENLVTCPDVPPL